MASHIKLIASIMIGSMLLLSIQRYSSSLAEKFQEKTMDSINAYHASEISKLLDYDFNRMGMRVNDISNIILIADTSHIKFQADIDNNGNVDTVEYILSVPSEASVTENPKDRILYRNVSIENNGEIEAGVTDFQLKYYDQLGNTTNVLTDITTIEISLECEGRFTYTENENYPKFIWNTKISPPNLIRFLF